MKQTRSGRRRGSAQPIEIIPKAAGSAFRLNVHRQPNKIALAHTDRCIPMKDPSIDSSISLFPFTKTAHLLKTISSPFLPWLLAGLLGSVEVAPDEAGGVDVRTRSGAF